ncbi:hypothetical protein [Rhodovulum sp. YEN HP10]
MADLADRVPKALVKVRGMAVSDQMRGAMLLDPRLVPIRPPILWPAFF